MQEQEFPSLSKVKITDDFVKKGAQSLKRKTLASDNWYLFQIVQVRRQVCTKGKLEGCLQVNLRCEALEDPNDVSSGNSKMPIWVNLNMPISNPEIPDHEPPEWVLEQIIQFYEAVFEDRFPKRTRGANAEEEALNNAKVTKAALEKSLEILEDPSLIEVKLFYGYIKKDKTGNFVNIRRFEPELPQGEFLGAVVAEGSDLVVAPKAPVRKKRRK